MRNIVNIPIQSVKPHSGSHNTKTVISLLKESIEQFGIQQPIIVDKNYCIVAGNAVYKACLDMGYTEVPCVVLDDLTDDQVAQYRIADNKTGEFARWNQEKLKKELSFMNDPTSLQYCFDESISSFFQKAVPVAPPHTVNTATPTVEKGEQEYEEDNRVNTDKQASEKAAFSDKLRKIDEDNAFAQDEYFTYTCSCCGRKVTVLLK